MKTKNPIIKTAIIGVSGFGNVHYRDLVKYQEKGLLEIVAATIINQDEEKEKCEKLRSLNCKIYTDYKQMLNDFKGRLDVCFIPTGIHLHKPMTVAALEAGVNVFVEKPLAATVQDVNEMKKSQKASGKFAAVGYQTMYTPEVMKIKTALCSGKLGKIRTVKCCALWPRAEAYYNRNNWAGRLKIKDAWVLDSPYNNALAHYLNLICFLAGQEVAKSAELKSIEAELYRANKIESADTACMRIMTKDAVPLYLTLTHACEKEFGPDMTVSCEKGEVRWSQAKSSISVSGGATEEMVNNAWDGLRTCVMDGILNRLGDKNAFICDLDIAGTQTLAANGAHESSEIHQIDEKFICIQTVKDGYTQLESKLHYVKGIEAIVMESYEKEKLFSELDAPWAVKGRIFSLENYTHFPL
ncbi:MAG: Gfo/Idh/MocA family oxidoreductase [Victivallales bacterium]